MTSTCVTGASGFIGSHLVKKMDGLYRVKYQDIACTDYSNTQKLFFLSTYGNMAHHQCVKEMVQANVKDLLNILSRFDGWLCYMSSSSVTLPVQTPYSRTKRAAEEILQALPELKSCIVRPYSVTGVGEQKKHLIPTLIRSCMEGEEMPFDPYPIHDFVDVEDVVDGLVRLSEKQSIGIFEFGNGFPISNRQVKEIVEIACGKKSNTKETTNLRKYDTDNWYCKYSRPEWSPKKNLFDSISEMVEDYKSTR